MPMVNSTSVFLSQPYQTADQGKSRVIKMKSEKLLTPSRDAVFFVQLFARAYRHTS